MADHTEGLWYVDAGDDVYKDGRMICAWPKNSDRTVAENRANLALIAAAPDLLEVAHMVTGAAKANRKLSEPQLRVVLDMLEGAALDAIAKAEGKADA